MEHPNYYVKQLTFNDGSTVDVNRDSIVVFVGANNSGKSRSLKDIATLVRDHNKDGLVVKSLMLNFATEFKLESYLVEVAKQTKESGIGNHYTGLGFLPE